MAHVNESHSLNSWLVPIVRNKVKALQSQFYFIFLLKISKNISFVRTNF